MDNNTTSTSGRIDWIDVIRSIACICVITAHAPIEGGHGGEWFLAPRLFLANSGASDLFFMISGALILYHPKSVKKFFKSKLLRIGIPLLIWSVISLLGHAAIHDITWGECTRRILLVPFVPQDGHYWFLYVLFGIYMLAPILSTWLERCGKSDLKVYLFVYLCALLVPYFAFFVPELNGLTDLRNGYLYYFSGFLWIAVLGYYIRRYVNIKKFRYYHVLIYALLLCSPGLFFLTPFPHGLTQNNLSIAMVALCVCHFILLKHLRYPLWLKKVTYKFSQYSFGIYLVHVLVKAYIVHPLLYPLNLNYLIQIPLVVLLLATISYVLVHLLSKLPKSKYLIGI